MLWENLADLEASAPRFTLNLTSLKGSEVYVQGTLAGKAVDAPNVRT